MRGDMWVKGSLSLFPFSKFRFCFFPRATARRKSQNARNRYEVKHGEYQWEGRVEINANVQSNANYSEILAQPLARKHERCS